MIDLRNTKLDLRGADGNIDPEKMDVFLTAFEKDNPEPFYCGYASIEGCPKAYYRENAYFVHISDEMKVSLCGKDTLDSDCLEELNGKELFIVNGEITDSKAMSDIDNLAKEVDAVNDETKEQDSAAIFYRIKELERGAFERLSDIQDELESIHGLREKLREKRGES